MELWGEAPSIESNERVTVGRPGRLGPRGRALAALVAVGVLLLGGLALGDHDADGTAGPREERDNRDRAALKTTTTSRPATTTTTTTIPVGPVFGSPVGASLLFMTGGSARATLVDLDTGVQRDVRIRTEDPWGAVPVRGGVVVVEGGVAELVPLAPAGSAAAREVVERVGLGSAEQVLSSGSLDSVWLLQRGLAGGGATPLRARLVDLQGRPLTGEIDVPADWAHGGTTEGVVFATGGRTYIATEDGVRPLAVAEVLDVAAGRVALRRCDDRASCGLEIMDVASGRSTRLPQALGSAYPATVVLAEDGGVAVLRHDQVAVLTLWGPDGQLLGSGPALVLEGEPVWLPGGLGLLVPSRGIRRVVVTDDGLRLEPSAALAGAWTDVVYVIPR